MNKPPNIRSSVPQALARVMPPRSGMTAPRAWALAQLADRPPVRSDADTYDLEVPTERLRPVTAPLPVAQPQYTPGAGGCGTQGCGHLARIHQRGKDTDRECTSTGCDCPGFRAPWTWRETVSAVVTVLLWLIAAAFVVGVAAVVMGGAP